MIPVGYLVAGAVGAVLMGKTKPKSVVKSLDVYGPKSGVEYKAERLSGLDVFIFTAPDGTRAAFERDSGKMRFLRGIGDERVVALMRKDFEESSEEKKEAGSDGG